MAGDAADTGLTPRRVLIVDDIVDVTESIAVLVSHWGHRVRTAYDGPSAITEARRFKPEIVLLDIGLPGMSGYEVAQQLRRLPETAHAKLIALTAYGMDEARERSKASGFDAHHIKPMPPTVLQELLADVQPRGRSSDESDAKR